MAIVNLLDFLRRAQATDSAVPATTVTDLRGGLDAIATAEALSAPLIISADPAGFRDFDADIVMPAVEAAAERSQIPIVLHRNGVADENALATGVRLGFCGVTLGADVPTARLKDLVGTAKDCGVAVGLTLSSQWNGVDQLKDLSVDLLELPVGSVPSEDREWQHPFRGTPLAVRHADGAVDHATLGRWIANGVCWVGLEQAARATAGLERLVRSLRAEGRASEFSRACRAWTPVEHVVEFNAPGVAETEVAQMLELGTKELEAIPGVREVRTGTAAKKDARYRYCWIIRFASPEVIASFKDHPAHVAFADGHFRPVATDRLTIDYLLHPKGVS